jgi:hypothetical protein
MGWLRDRLLRRRGGVPRLIPEPDNPYDSFAIRGGGRRATVGYVSPGNARRHRRRLVAMTRGDEPIVPTWGAMDPVPRTRTSAYV